VRSIQVVTGLNMNLKRAIDKFERQAAQIIATRQRAPFISLATMLYGGSLLYGTGARVRQKLFAHGLLPAKTINKPVISVGNLTAGGTGKTPMTVHLAQLLIALNYKVLIVSRGYKSLNEKGVALVSHGGAVTGDAWSTGDEPYLMARLVRQATVMVGRNRAETAIAGIRRFNPDIVLLDDAFQHQALARDLNLLLLDAEEPFGNGYLLPRGPLREPVSAIQRADAIIFTRSHGAHTETQRQLSRMIHPKPVFHCRHTSVLRCVVPGAHSLGADEPLRHHCPEDLLQGRPVFAFAALANNANFWSAVSRVGARLLGTMGFPDHHRFSSQDIEDLVQAAHRSGCRTLVTTDKDFVRLPRSPLPMELIVLGVEIDFGAEYDRWRKFIVEKATTTAELVDRRNREEPQTG
jgi:tetraacyldisaccharide 4'-kinase